MPPTSTKSTSVASLKHQNEKMSQEIGNLRAEFQRLQADLSQYEEALDVYGGRGPHPETEKSLEFMGEYDDLKNSYKTANEKLANLMKRLVHHGRERL